MPNVDASKTHLQVVTHDMPIRTLGTCDQNSALVVPLLRNGVRRAVLAWFASKGELIRGWFLGGNLVVAGVVRRVRDC